MLRSRAPPPVPMPYPNARIVLGAAGIADLVAFARRMPRSEPVGILSLDLVRARPATLARAMPERGEAWLVAANGRDRARATVVLASPGASERVAREILRGVDLGLCAVGLGEAANKYVGETEKNLRRVFEAAAEGGAVLFFDEADALFGRRSDVKDAHDRYAEALLIEQRSLAARVETPLVRVIAREMPWRLARRKPNAVSRAGFHLFNDARREWRWRLVEDDGEIAAISSESYKRRRGAENGIAVLREMRAAPEVYQDARREWRWRLVHANGRIIATAGEGYAQRSDCEQDLALTETLARDAPFREV